MKKVNSWKELSLREKIGQTVVSLCEMDKHIASFGSPYLYKYYTNSKITYINAYSSTKNVVSAFVKAMFGDISFDGISSVKL